MNSHGGRSICGWTGLHFVRQEEQLGGKGGGRKNIFVLQDLFTRMLGREVGGAREVFI